MKLTEQEWIKKFKKEGFELYKTESLKPKLDELEALKDGWISVDDRLPTEYGQYLIYCPQSFPKNCRFLSANFYPDNNLFYGDASEVPHEDVTHWRVISEPLPERTTENQGYYTEK